MIKVTELEYKEGDCAMRTVTITFFNIPIYKYSKKSTNQRAIALLGPISSTKVKGFI